MDEDEPAAAPQSGRGLRSGGLRLRLPHFFIERPIFAAVISIIIVILGIIAYPTLPVAQYPDIAPPTVIVSASYPGANAQTMAEVVSQPLEEAINGVENMTYMTSGSTGDGKVAITVTFDQGTDADQAQVLVQNRVATAEPRLPQEVRNIGITTRKNSPDMLMIVGFNSPHHTLSRQYISNYVALQLVDRLSRVKGVGGVRTVGAREYNMRIWIDPDLAASRDITVNEILAAVRAQNAQVAAGAIGQPPFGARHSGYQIAVQAQGRLSTPQEFGDIIIKRNSQGGLTRLRDVARIELGALDYSAISYIDQEPTVFVGISQLPGSNALATAEALKAELKKASKTFPPDLAYKFAFNPTEHIRDSISAVNRTLGEALLLVVLVVLLFLQSWRAAIIPIIAIPVSLIGAVAAMGVFHFSLNNLTLFGMLLAIGIVVDDAIVVVENIERLMEEEGMTPREAAHETMDEVAGAVVAIALVLFGVFVPTAFIPGVTGAFYKQFALTIVSATAISAFVSLSLSPALAALLLKPRVRNDEVARMTGWRTLPVRFAHRFNHEFDRLSHRYSSSTARTIRRLVPVGLIYLLLIGLAGWRFYATPTGFIPTQDESALVGAVQLPPGSSLDRTNDILLKFAAMAKKHPDMLFTSQAAGIDGTNFSAAPNYAIMFMTLKPRAERDKNSREIAAELMQQAASIHGGRVIVLQPPPVRGLGINGGWKMMIQDRSNAGYQKLEEVTNRMVMEGNQTPGLSAVFTGFNTKSPAVTADIDRARAEQMGLGVDDIFATLGTYLGSTYVNDFNFLGKTYRVTAQADADFRSEESDITRLQARSSSGGMVPLASVVTLHDTTVPYRVVRYNMYPTAELQGATAPGYSSGEGLATASALASRILPQGFDFEWTELAYEQLKAGNTGIYVFGLSVLFVFLLLAANYESLVLPLAVILIVPMCILAAMLGVNFLRLDNNILTQIGMVVLIGLAAKNAILIVEFARQGEEMGLSVREAVERAAHQRLRPIVMTSIAFIFGTLPLVIAKGPGFEMRQALGVAVCFGMAGVTGFGLIFTPAFYVMARKLGDRVRQWWRARGHGAAEAG
jgi:hydrophobe/amphiphile efflux-1 (HAE1) family protein